MKCRIWMLKLNDGRLCTMHCPDLQTQDEFKQSLPGLFIGRRVVAVRGLRYVGE